MIGAHVRVPGGITGVVLRHHPNLPAWVVRLPGGEILSFTDDRLVIA